MSSNNAGAWVCQVCEWYSNELERTYRGHERRATHAHMESSNIGAIARRANGILMTMADQKTIAIRQLTTTLRQDAWYNLKLHGFGKSEL